MPLVYDELHRVAANAMRRETPGHTLQPTALVHEAYLRIVDQQTADWKSRGQFYSIAAAMMRRVLVDHARSRLAKKRWGAAEAFSLENVAGEMSDPVDILNLDDALARLHDLDPVQSRVVELRYFTGLNIEDTALAMDISPSTVKREWAIARAWLRRELS